ncbi:MAG: ester cyclase [Nitriliruptorales bacterium]|nr:ester cyclase [Nitriliruptorales bacterium]
MAQTETQHRSAAELMEQDFAYVAAHDVDGIMSLAHEDIVEDFLAVRTLRGKAEVRAYFEQIFAATPDLVFEVEEIHEVDDTTAVGQWRMYGTFSGAEFEGIQPTGRRVDLRGIDVMRLEDGLLKHNTIYYDGLSFARQIGMLPADDSPGDRAMKGLFNGVTTIKRAVQDTLNKR